MTRENSREWAVSEVIGSVLLVGLVVVGAGVAGAIYFSQAPPKELPHLSFSADFNNTVKEITLFHTGGDTLLWGEFRIYIDGEDKTTNVKQQIPWSFNQPLTITGVGNYPGTIVLSYVDGGGGESILRKVMYTEDGLPRANATVTSEPVPTVSVTQTVTPAVPWSISGFKRNASDGAGLEGVTISLTAWHNTSFGTRTTTSGSDGSYSFTDLPQEEENYTVSEIVPANWHAVDPSTGTRMVHLTNESNNATDENFTNAPLVVTPTPRPTIGPWTISGYKRNGLDGSGVEGVSITLHKKDGQTTLADMTSTTDGNGFYIFDVKAAQEQAKYDISEIVPMGWHAVSPTTIEVHLNPSEQHDHEVNVNFTNERDAAVGTIAGRVWADTDGDGQMDGGESMLANWAVTLTPESGSPHQAATNATGWFQFSALETGSYIVTQHEYPNWTRTYPASGNYSVTLTAGSSTNLGCDFGNRNTDTSGPGEISGTVWNDLNGNGARDAGEPGLGNRTVLLREQGGGGSNESTGTTDANGGYVFASLPLYHAYVVSQSIQSGWVQTCPTWTEASGLPGVYNLSIDSGTSVHTGVDFGVRELAGPTPTPSWSSGRVSGLVWNDDNGDRIRSGEEFVLPGWTVVLALKVGEPDQWSEVGRVLTNESGQYAFANLSPGAYRVAEDLQEGWTRTWPLDSNGTHLFNLSEANPIESERDFGNRIPPTPIPTLSPGTGWISGYKFNDTNQDHTWNEGENGLYGWVIYVLEQQGDTWVQAGSATTDATGFYNITGLDEGTYRVYETQKMGWLQQYPDTAEGYHAVTLSYGHQGQADVNFGNYDDGLPNGSGEVSGMKYHDLDDDHHKDTAEPGLPGWTIYLERQEDGGSTWYEVGRTVTDANGNYGFGGLIDGHYRTYEVEQPGWRRTYPTDSGGWQNFVVNKGRVQGPDTKRDFGNFRLTMLEGVKYHDQNANHVFDYGEPPLAGWTIVLFRKVSGNWVEYGQTTTGSDGLYRFLEVPYGEYRVAEVQQPNWNQTAPTTNGGTHIVTISEAQKHWIALDFGNYDGPIAGYGNLIILNNPQNSAVMKDGYYIQFRNHGSWEYVQFEGQPQISIPAGSTVRLEINGDQTSGKIYMIHQQLSTFSFNARLYVNGVLRGSGRIANVWFAPTGAYGGGGVDQFVTNMHYLVSQRPTGFQLQVDHVEIVNPPWWPYTDWGVNIYSFGPASDPGGYLDTVLNLDFQDGRTYLVCSGWYEVIK
jgi:hypothetical protein